MDWRKKTLKEIEISPASEQEKEDTIAVMGGEDWENWIKSLKEAKWLSKNCLTLAYSYIGPQITAPIYREGTIGEAKKHLENSAQKITEQMASIDGKAIVAVNKALVTQASSAIPVIPLYISILYKVMTEKNVHETTKEQIDRLFAEKLPSSQGIVTDEKGRIRLDDKEMSADIQDEVSRRWEMVSEENLEQICDIHHYERDFLKLFGFGLESVDYNIDVSVT